MRLEAGGVAVVTGAASGIGFALAEAFAGRGLAVMLADVRPAEVEAAAATLRHAGATVEAAMVDVRSAEELQRLARTTISAFGRVDVVCNNAGVAPPPAPMWELPLETWRWTLDVALLGVIHGIRAFVPLLVAQNHGHIVNTASVGGLVPLPGMGPYHAAKTAVVGLSETLRAELDHAAPEVGVSVLCPGLVDTPLPVTTRQNAPGGGDATTPVTAMSALAGRGRSILSAAAVADLTLRAVERNQLHVITHADSRDPVLARVRALLADLPPEAAPSEIAPI